MQGLEQALAEFMSARYEWEGTSSKLLSELSRYAEGEDWPHSPKALTLKLKELRDTRLKVGFRRLGAARLVTLTSDTFPESDTSSDTSKDELVTHAVTDKPTVTHPSIPLETTLEQKTSLFLDRAKTNWQQAPRVDCHNCKHYQGRDNPDYKARSCAVKQWHFPCYGWRPCSKFVEVLG